MISEYNNTQYLVSMMKHMGIGITRIMLVATLSVVALAVEGQEKRKNTIL